MNQAKKKIVAEASTVSTLYRWIFFRIKRRLFPPSIFDYDTPRDLATATRKRQVHLCLCRWEFTVLLRDASRRAPNASLQLPYVKWILKTVGTYEELGDFKWVEK